MRLLCCEFVPIPGKEEALIEPRFSRPVGACIE